MRPNRSMPSCSVIPELGYEDVGAAIEWLCGAFDFIERWRAGAHRAQLRIGDGAIVVCERSGTPTEQGFASMMVRVEDLDSHLARASAHGARILAEPHDYPYGERQYGALDIGGHRWTFSETLLDVAPEEWGGVSAGLL